MSSATKSAIVSHELVGPAQHHTALWRDLHQMEKRPRVKLHMVKHYLVKQHLVEHDLVKCPMVKRHMDRHTDLRLPECSTATVSNKRHQFF